MFAGNAVGDYLPRMVVYKAQNLYRGWTEGVYLHAINTYLHCILYHLDLVYLHHWGYYYYQQYIYIVNEIIIF